jgi:hypothetical protein
LSYSTGYDALDFFATRVVVDAGRHGATVARIAARHTARGPEGVPLMRFLRVVRVPRSRQAPRSERPTRAFPYLQAAITERLSLAQERETIMRRVLNTLIKAKLAEWRRAADDSRGKPAPIEPAQLTETLGSMLPQQKAELIVATLAEATLRIATADDPAKLSVLGTPVKRSLHSSRSR